jgi:hypothetical protein
MSLRCLRWVPTVSMFVGQFLFVSVAYSLHITHTVFPQPSITHTPFFLDEAMPRVVGQYVK